MERQPYYPKKNNVNTSHKICRFYSEGYCKFKENCKFLHVKEAHNNTRVSTSQTHVECEEFLQNKCKDRNCTKYHNFSILNKVNIFLTFK